MLADIRRILILREDSKLILFEPVRGQGDRKDLCRGTMSREELLKLLEGNGFKLTKEHPAGDAGSWFEFEIKN